jgi:acylglycerol lipase
MANGLDRSNLSRDQAVIAAYNADPLVHDRISARLGLDLITIGDWVLQNAARFPVPLLLVVGSKDTLISAPAVGKFAQAAPVDNITFKEWDGHYHETHNETQKEQVLQYMVEWLNRLI